MLVVLVVVEGVMVVERDWEDRGLWWWRREVEAKEEGEGRRMPNRSDVDKRRRCESGESR